MAHRTKRQRARREGSTDMTVDEADALRAQVASRLKNANSVANQSLSLGGAKGGNLTAQGSRVKDPATDDVRKYRKDKYNIDDLRSATAEQIEAARKDPKAFRNRDQNAGVSQLALAQVRAAAQGGTKPATFSGYPGGRRPPPLGTGLVQQTLKFNPGRRKRRNTARHVSVGGSG